MTDILRVQPPLAYAELQRPGTVFCVQDKRLIWRGEYGDGEINVEDFETGQLYRPVDPQTGIRQVATVQWLQSAIAFGDFQVIRNADGTPHETKRAPCAEMDREEILKTDAFAEARQTLLQRLYAAGATRNDPNLSSAIDSAWAELDERFGKRPATSTVREWMTWTDPELPSLSQLVSNAGRVPRAKRLDSLVREVIEQRADWYWADHGRQIKDAEAAGHADIVKINVERREEGLPPLKQPSREAYRRAVRASESKENYERKHGKTAAERYWRPSMGGNLAKHALELVFMDDTPLDVVACVQSRAGQRFPAGRPYLCVALDLATRCVVGFVLSFKPPTTHTAAECLKRVGREKMHLTQDWTSRYPVLRQVAGKPQKLYCDNGANYVSGALQDACAEAGITLVFAPVDAPKAKAAMERFFRTLKTWLLAKLPGHTLDPRALREMGINPEARAVLLVEELEELIQEFINTYHISIHCGLNEQPAAAWLRSIESRPRSILDERALDMMTLLTVHGRRLTTNGVRWQHLSYRGENLEQLLASNLPREKMSGRLKATAAATVKIKIDPENVGHIFVFDPETRTYRELFATQQDYAAGLTLDQHEQALAWAKRRNLAFNSEEERMAALNNLNEFIQKRMPSLATRERRVLARTTEGPIARDEVDVPIGYADPRHDGFGETIEHASTDNDRIDWDQKPSRPAKGKVADGGSHDADGREDWDQSEFDPATGLFLSPADEDELFEEEYA
ncbi:DDE-type integrase/transposase/recombinase [Sphingomonas sp.]|uniref:Mu transposase C-terminal domain-containing protein n=1 Tax=Sphingomonas sp. TaxID=28214 RepID=UPI001EB4FD76|nr:DDE-type integrase/transposase/recombinase [Sphingomonas sp.]MBX3595068.1 DDE-type integrase/transposase/recombinase [Sphingomonas sp.]